MASRPFAAFDIDGTLLRWQLYHAVADELARQGHLETKAYEKVRQARLLWKKRPHKDSYAQYELELIDFFENAVTSIDPSVFEEACKQVVDVYKDQVYAYTRDLIKQLKSQTYLLFAISASPIYIVKLLADYYGFDDAVGSVYEIKDGQFTGKNDVLKAERKVEELNKLIKKYTAKYEGSTAVGDSESDIPMLSAVENPIAFNPTRGLFEHAKKQGWQVILERKNMTYKLEPHNGQFKIR